jgi:methylation protein EvaC
MRYTVQRKGEVAPAPSVALLRGVERAAGLDRAETFERLRERIEASRRDLVGLLRKVRAQGKRVVGYGATSKSTTVTNYCGITTELVEYISDTTPIKQGKVNPGTHIPVRPYQDFQADPPDYALLFAWNHADEITRKEASYLAGGGRFITYVPRVGTIP